MITLEPIEHNYELQPYITFDNDLCALYKDGIIFFKEYGTNKAVPARSKIPPAIDYLAHTIKLKHAL